MPDYNLDRIRNIIGEINAAYTKLEMVFPGLSRIPISLCEQP